MREYMRLLLSSIISNNSLFCGDVNSLTKKTYFHVGRILLITLVHGGPATFFAEPVADYILYGFGKVKVFITDVQDRTIEETTKGQLFNRELCDLKHIVPQLMLGNNLIVIIVTISCH